jgi:hypothetical protein
MKMRRKKSFVLADEKFQGFPDTWKKNFWMYPRAMDKYWRDLNGSEQKVLDFILRQTWGWEKQSDSISLSQFEKGIGENNKGIGLSKKAVIRAVQGLEEKGFVTVERTDYGTNRYSLVTEENKGDVSKINQSCGFSDTTSCVENTPRSSVLITHTIDKVPIEKAIDMIYGIYTGTINPGERETVKGRKVIRERFVNIHPRDMTLAIQNFSEDGWQMQNNARRGAIWFFGSDEKIMQYVNLNPTNSNPRYARKEPTSDLNEIANLPEINTSDE